MLALFFSHGRVLASDIAVEIREACFSLQNLIDCPSSSLDGLLGLWRWGLARLRHGLRRVSVGSNLLSGALWLEHWLPDRSSSLESGCSRCIKVCAWQRPLRSLHSWERHLCCPRALSSAVAIPDTAGDFRFRKTSWGATVAAGWRKRCS
jgi:hypothetical protein